MKWPIAHGASLQIPVVEPRAVVGGPGIGIEQRDFCREEASFVPSGGSAAVRARLAGQ